MTGLYYWDKEGVLTRTGEQVNESRIKTRLDSCRGNIVLVQSIQTSRIGGEEYALPVLSHGPFSWLDPVNIKDMFCVSPYCIPADNTLDAYLSFKKFQVRGDIFTGIARIIDHTRKRIYEDTTMVHLWEREYMELKIHLNMFAIQGIDLGDEKQFFEQFQNYCFSKRELLEVYGVAHCGSFGPLVEDELKRQKE